MQESLHLPIHYIKHQSIHLPIHHSIPFIFDLDLFQRSSTEIKIEIIFILLTPIALIYGMYDSYLNKKYYICNQRSFVSSSSKQFSIL